MRHCRRSSFTASLLALAALLSGCGTYVPSLEDYAADPRAEAQLVQAILTNVKCELRKAIHEFDHPDPNSSYTRPRPTLIDGWGIITNLALTISEKSAANPTAELLPVTPATAIFTASLGVAGSAEATRTDKLASFITVAEIRRLNRKGPCSPQARGGPFLLQDDLKLSHWLSAALLGQNTHAVDLSTTKPSDDPVLTHDVKFQIVTSGSITPQWTLVRANVNNGGTFLSAGRDRTHQLTITLGPTDKQGPSRQLSDAALTQAIGNAVAASIRRN